jgi:hypothetical protein
MRGLGANPTRASKFSLSSLTNCTADPRDQAITIRIQIAPILWMTPPPITKMLNLAL